VDRAAALRAGPERVPRKVMIGMVTGFLLLGVGGVLGEHYFSNSKVASSTATTTLAGIVTPTMPPGRQLNGSLDAFIALKNLGNSAAPEISLRTQHSRVWSLSAQRGHVVLLTFFDATCHDVCPVIRNELVAAQADLGAQARNVEFVAINTDPFQTSLSAVGPATAHPAPKGFIFLTGPLRTLNSTWANYGVTVTVGSTHSQIAHNDICFVIDAHGNLRDQMTPFANEDAHGHYSLPAPQILRFAKAMARVITSLESQ
jgi:cytochrome oxidase Cu insertion factor (SCO1/SenC/PrrC family)